MNKLFLNSKATVTLFFLIFIVAQTVFSQSETEALKSVFSNTTSNMRGKIQTENGQFRLDFYDIYEKDAQGKFLQEKGYHGGGPSWLGIIFGAFKLCDSDLIDEINMNVEATGITFFSTNKAELETIGRIIASVKSDENILLKSIDKAEEFDMML